MGTASPVADTQVVNVKAMLGQGLFVLVVLPTVGYVLEVSHVVGPGPGGALFGLGFCLGGAMVMTAVVVGVVRAATREPRR